VNKQSIFEQLGNLVATFERDVRLGVEMSSPNNDDDLAIKTAIVGFSYNARTQDWDLGHFEFVKGRLARELPGNELAEYGPNADNVRLFLALSIGYLLGLHHQDAITDEEFRRAELLLPGLIMQHLGRLTARPPIEENPTAPDP